MQVTVKRGEKVIYSQMLDDSKTLNASVSFMMEQPQGETIETTISNNGHDLVFRSNNLSVPELIKHVNGAPAPRKARTVVATPALAAN